jgi:hypothetical protein
MQSSGASARVEWDPPGVLQGAVQQEVRSPRITGRYQLDYGAEQGALRLRPFLPWCAANGVRGLVGEFGVPGSDPRWLLRQKSSPQVPRMAVAGLPQ